MPTITLKFKDNVIGSHPIEKGTSLTIGRRMDNDIVIDNLAVSGHHARIDSVGEAFVLVDLQSKNGTFVNEQLVSSHWLKHGDHISIGKHLLAFSSGDGTGAADTPASEIDKTMVMDTSNYRSMVQKSTPVVPKPLRRQSEPIGCLTYLSGGQGQLDLTQKLIKIGKDPTSEIVVKGFFIGSTAATISRRPDGYYLSHAGGMTKPRINGQTVKKSARLQNLDLVQIGPVELKFFLKEPSPAGPA
ncbi:MAG: FHA domain-containing protein [Deltaproteobacteria bacterium]|nr:FHA domain-containing protein [Deltaproteobacteria bacterium]